MPTVGKKDCCQLWVEVLVQAMYDGTQYGAKNIEIEAYGTSCGFVFHPGYRGVGARCDVWPNQNIGWTPEPGVWHNLKVTLRSSGRHTFAIGDGQDEDKVWQKDLQMPGLFGNEIRVRAKPHLPDGLLPKPLQVVGEEVILANAASTSSGSSR